MMSLKTSFYRVLLGLGGALLFAQAIFGAGTEALKFRVADFGAVGDGSTLNTAALQKAIDTCSQQGGGSVVVSAGRYVTGTLELKDKVVLQLEEQATLLGSTRAEDYRKVDPFTDGTGAELGYALIVAVEARGVGLTGAGTIDGRGKELAAAEGKYTKRPFLIRWVRCRGVSVSGLTLRSSGAWTMHLSQSKDVVVENVTIRSRGLSNNDGIDIDSCEDVRIRNCDIDTGDDAICLKTTRAAPCRRVEVSHCRLKTSCAALKVGTESLGDFADIQIEHCEILGAGLGGIKLLSVDGANLSGVRISDVQMREVRVPVFIRLGARLRTFRPGESGRPVGSIDDIVVRNLRAENATQIGVLITGIPDHPVTNVRLEEIQISLPGGGSAEQSKAELPEKEQAYPEVKMFGDAMPAYGVYLRHAYGITLANVQLTLKNADQRPAVLCLDAKNADLGNLKSGAATPP